MDELPAPGLGAQGRGENRHRSRVPRNKHPVPYGVILYQVVPAVTYKPHFLECLWVKMTEHLDQKLRWQIRKAHVLTLAGFHRIIGRFYCASVHYSGSVSYLGNAELSEAASSNDRERIQK